MRPLDFLGRIKVKLGIVIVLAVVTAFGVNEIGFIANLPRPAGIAIAVVLALIMVQLLARGMTKPLREMAAAAQTIAKGRHGLRVTATSRDEVGELARAFNAMAADLAEVDRQRRELVANVSHELRTPITGLQAVLENVVDGVSPPDVETLGTALAQTQRLGRLVVQLLDLSRLDSGARLVEPEVLDLVSLCRQAAREAGLTRDDVTVRSEVPPGTSLLADPDLLAQVLANLLDNAVRHSPPGGTVWLKARGGGPDIEIGVIDSGPGIATSERAKVFERFSRLDAGRTADVGGAGLGLAIVKEIVELHGGSIRVADQESGCHMLVTLPGRSAGSSASDVINAACEAAEPGSGGGQAAADTVAAITGGATASAGAGAAAGATEAVAEGVSEVATDVAALGAGFEVAAGHRPVVSIVDQTALDMGSAGSGSAGSGSVNTGAKGVAEIGPGIGTGTGTGIDSRTDSRMDSQTGTDFAGTADAVVVAALTAGEGFAGAAGAAEAPPSSDLAGTGRRLGQMQPEAPVVSNEGPAFGRYAGSGGPSRIRAALGAGIGMFIGFAAGLFVAFFLGLILGGPFGVIAMLLITCAGAVVGAAMGAQSGPAASPHAVTRARMPQEGPSRPAPAGQAWQLAGQAWEPAGQTWEYVPPPLFPQPDLPDTPRWMLPAVAVVGFVASIAVPDAPTGIGLVMTAIAMGVAVLPALRANLRQRVTPWTVALGLLAYALVSMAFFRDADWLVLPVLLAAFGIAALALSGGGTGWLGVVHGGLAVLVALLPVPWFLAVPMRRLLRLRRLLPALISVAVTVTLLGVFGLLFASADPVFSALVRRVLSAPEWVVGLPLRIVLFAGFAVVTAAAILVALRPVAEPTGPDLRMSVGRALWVMPLAGLNLLFASFVAVQITALFGGNRRIVSTAGLTYADDARAGFFQLVTVSVFVLGVLAAAVLLLSLKGRGDRWILAGLLGLLCAFTLVILVSAMLRLGIYIDAYGLTRLRASVGATILWLGAVFVVVLIASGVRLAHRGTPWFPRTLVMLTGVSLLAFAIWNPEARVAETQFVVRGIDRMDQDYLGHLAAEAVPELDRLPEPTRTCVLREVVKVNGLTEPDPWNGWNLARARARAVLARHPLLDDVTCDTSSTRS